MEVLIPWARMFRLQQSTATAEKVVRNKEKEEGRKEKGKPKRLGRRERRRRKV